MDNPLYTVRQLREFLAALPDDLPVVTTRWASSGDEYENVAVALAELEWGGYCYVDPPPFMRPAPRVQVVRIV